jgi:hypothetical protein
VYVTARPADGRKALRAGWVLNGVLLGMTVVLLVAVMLLTRHAVRGGAVEPAALLATGGWWMIAMVMVGLLNLALLVLGIVAMAQGAALRGLALLMVSAFHVVVCWLALTSGAWAVFAWTVNRFAPPPAMQAPIEGEERKIGGGFSPLPR